MVQVFAARIGLIAVFAMGLMALSSTPALAKTPDVNVRYAWSSPSATVEAGETVTVTAEFGRRCRDRKVSLQEKPEGEAWATLYTVGSEDAKSLAFSIQTYGEGTTAYRVKVNNKRACKASVSEAREFTVETGEDTDTATVE